MTAFLLVIVFLVSALLTGVMRTVANRHNLVAVPNERSSHAAVTSTGGGVGLVVATLIAVALMPAFGHGEPVPAIAIVLGGGLIAVTGFIDDRMGLSPATRLGAQLVASIALIAALPAGVTIPTPYGEIAFTMPQTMVLILPLIWGINLYNFMDGIDGLASVEAITVAGGAVAILMFFDETTYQFPLAATAIAALGFLLWNWPPAKIFMGDVGSGFLGYLFGTFVLLTTDTALNIWAWLTLLGVFIVDSTVTLVNRLRGGEAVFEAHRTHAYQHAAIRLRGHLPVTLAVGAINILWLLPLACVAARYPESGIIVVLFAWAPLFALALRLGAGRS